MRFTLHCLLTLVAAMGVAGCERNKPSGSDSDQKAEIETKLAGADAYDGTVDKIVSKCAVCRLGMDGIEEHKIKAHDYELYFCKSGCKEHFAEDVDKAILALKIPDK